MDFDHTYADYLDKKAIKDIQSLEEQTGKRILAFYTPPGSADLTDEQLQKIQALEKRLCVRLVAYDGH